jgi:hypothetical protein
LNDLQGEQRHYGNEFPNAGINFLAEQRIYDNKDNIYENINGRLRDIVFRALDRYQIFDEYVQGIFDDQINLIRHLTQCYPRLSDNFRIESDEDLESIRNCYSD